jgi:hypothetical protein
VVDDVPGSDDGKDVMSATKLQEFGESLPHQGGVASFIHENICRYPVPVCILYLEPHHPHRHSSISSGVAE